MNDTVIRVASALSNSGLHFSDRPILVGGQAMEYYGIRRSGDDIDLIITDADYQRLAQAHPDRRRDLYGDLGVAIGEFEIWRSIAHLDYEFFSKDAISEGAFRVISIDRLLWTRVCAMDVEKYRNDLALMREYYYKRYTNPQYHSEALLHESSYRKLNGLVLQGMYQDD